MLTDFLSPLKVKRLLLQIFYRILTATKIFFGKFSTSVNETVLKSNIIKKIPN